MPATKKPGDEVYSGSTCKQGEIEAVVIATGVHTFFGKAAHLVDSTNNVGHFQKVMNKHCTAYVSCGEYLSLKKGKIAILQLVLGYPWFI